MFLVVGGIESWIAEESLSLEEWLGYLNLVERKRPRALANYCFPSDRHFAEYIFTIHQRTDRQVKQLLRNFLITGGSLGVDTGRLQHYASLPNLGEIIQDQEYVRRLFNMKTHTWEGMTWILDLLPSHPSTAIAAIEAYDLAHYFLLPDGRVAGLHDATAVIRAKYIDAVSPEKLVDSLSSREFEFLTAALFLQECYKVTPTKATRDGGYDLLAVRESSLVSERILVECKCQHAPVGIEVARQLVGVVDAAKAARGVLVTSSTFTGPAIDYAKASGRLELLDHVGLCKRLNGHFGPTWIRRASEISRLAKTSLNAL